MWVWLSLLLGVCVEATSNGVNIICDVDYKLGTSDRKLNKNLTMSWVTSAAFANQQYTLRTADPSSTTDPKAYVPGEWTTIYIRTTNQDQQFTGLVLYATNKDNLKVGKWQVPFNVPYHTTGDDQCVVHSNADPKNYLSTFKFLGPPVGTGPITIKALIKFGLAFPSDTSMFWWPNDKHLVLTEAAQTSRVWYEGEVGENCIDVCRKRNLGCDLQTMRLQGNSSAMLAKVAAYSNCSGALMPGCSSFSPSVGTGGCFYHSETCVQPSVEPAWTRVNICKNLSAYVSGKIYCDNQGGPTCCTYQSAKWCCSGYTSAAPVDPSSPTAFYYGAWSIQTNQGGRKGPCMPDAGWPAGQGSVMLPTRVLRSSTSITCEATSKSHLDGQRICACSMNGQREANSAVLAELPLALSFFLVLAASF